MSNAHITEFREGFKYGFTKILGLDDIALNVGMGFGILKLKSGQSSDQVGLGHIETQLVVLKGRGNVVVDGTPYYVVRQDVFPVIDKKTNIITDDSYTNPWAFDIPPGCPWSVAADSSGLELAVITAENQKRFTPVVVRPYEVPSEQRGQGQAGGTMHRIVKAILGDPNAPYRPPESNLVVGEVVNFPGKWSSYPPHYHPHNEVYYYRFDAPTGYGASFIDHGSVPRVYTHDVVKIMNCVGHSQVSAPGYAMWYLWFIRQIEGNRYEGNPPFKFFDEHKWVLDL